MKNRVLSYVGWALLCYLFAFGYVRLIFGALPEASSSWFMGLLTIIYKQVLIRFWILIGSIITILFVLIDAVYLRKKLKNHANAVIIQFFVLLGVVAIVACIHYFLEKTIDVM